MNESQDAATQPRHAGGRAHEPHDVALCAGDVQWQCRAVPAGRGLRLIAAAGRRPSTVPASDAPAIVRYFPAMYSGHTRDAPRVPRDIGSDARRPRASDAPSRIESRRNRRSPSVAGDTAVAPSPWPAQMREHRRPRGHQRVPRAVVSREWLRRARGVTMEMRPVNGGRGRRSSPCRAFDPPRDAAPGAGDGSMCLPASATPRQGDRSVVRRGGSSTNASTAHLIRRRSRGGAPALPGAVDTVGGRRTGPSRVDAIPRFVGRLRRTLVATRLIEGSHGRRRWRRGDGRCAVAIILHSASRQRGMQRWQCVRTHTVAAAG